MPEKEAVRPEATPLRIDFESRFQRLLASLEVAGLQVRHSQMVLADSRAALGSRTLQVLDSSQVDTFSIIDPTQSIVHFRAGRSDFLSLFGVLQGLIGLTRVLGKE